ncbi:MAG: sigma-70 family RNA polymerase sigma factor [Bacteroidales bacterium]
MKPINSIKSDYFLWEHFKDGDKSALDEIYKFHYASLFDYGFRIIKDTDFIRECIQELFYELISNRKTLGATHNIRFYLLASIRRKIFSKIRNRSHFQPDYDFSYRFDLELSPEDNFIKVEGKKKRREDLKKIVNKLPCREKEVIYLKFYKDLNYEEITRVMGINYDSARKLLHRAIKNLRKLMSVELNHY